MKRSGASLVDTTIVEEIPPTNTDRREAHDYVVAVRFVLQSNCLKNIADLSNDQLDCEN